MSVEFILFEIIIFLLLNIPLLYMSQSGAGKAKKVKKVLKSVDKFLKDKKLISKGAKVLVKIAPEKHKKKLQTTAEVAEMLGYGKRGSGLGIPGGALRLAGQRGRGKKKGAKKGARRKAKK